MSQGNLVGQSLAQYQIRELLGMGGMGAVYRAYQTNLKREVAVKIITANLVADKEMMARFIREAEVSAQLEHPNIVPIYDFGTFNGITYVVMRMLTGGSLSRRIEQRIEDARPLISLGETADLVKQVGSALDYAHSYGVIHRDIKPANIMFDNQGKPYVVDFGIAKIATAGTAYTQTGTAMGTPNYMPPEQWRGEALTPAADQYALAVMTYQLLTGRVPFDGDSVFSLMHKHLNEMPTPLSIVRPDLPPAIMIVLSRALAKDASQRFQSCTAFAQAFESSIEGHKGQPTGMFVFKVRPSAQTNAVPISNKSISQQPSNPQISHSYTPTPMPAYNTQPPPPSNAQNPLVWGLGLALIAVIALLLIVILGGDDDTAPSVTADNLSPTQAGLVIVNNPTETIASEITDDFTPVPSPTDTATITATNTDSPTSTPINTLDVQLAARATIQQIDTLTAESFTDTPTPDIDATIVAEVTRIYFADLTQIASQWTSTPTDTDVPTSTDVPTETPTTTPTSTDVPTETPTTTPTSTDVPTETPTATPTSTDVPTETPVSVISVSPEEQSAFVAVTRNESWTPIERDFDGVTMVLVPVGCFLMGSEIGNDDEKPVHTQCFDAPFWLDKYEVSNGQFTLLGGSASLDSRWTGDDFPRENILWTEARDFCELRGGRLPTEAEWEYSARGPNNWIYPWGNVFDADNAVYIVNSNEQTARIGSRPDGISWVGALDMSGNVQEWMSSLYLPYPYTDQNEDMTDTDSARVMRGGAWDLTEGFMSLSNRGGFLPNLTTSARGFRCVRDIGDGEFVLSEAIPTNVAGQNTAIVALSSITPTHTTTPMATATSQFQTVTVTSASANLRGGPGTNYRIVGSVVSGTVLTVIARTTDSQWYLIEYGDDNERAWISAIVATLSGENSTVSVAATIPAPPATSVVVPTSVVVATSVAVPTSGTGNNNPPPPSISVSAYVSGTCAEHTYVVSWSSNINVNTISALSPTDYSPYDSRGVGGTSGSTSFGPYYNCTASSCGLVFRATGDGGVTSGEAFAEIFCD
jgi:serine/threonine-protein kinase